MKSVKFKLDLQKQVAFTSKNIGLGQISTKVYTQAIEQFVDTELYDRVTTQLAWKIWNSVDFDLTSVYNH
jgi:hypothetical protein